MTNYNQRLDKILLNYAAKYFQLLRTGAPKELELNIRAEAKQAITSLIKEMVVEAKPHYTSTPNHNFGTTHETGMSEGYNLAIDEFEQNLLKALEEV